MLSNAQVDLILKQFDTRIESVKSRLLRADDMGEVKALQGEAIGVTFAKNTIIGTISTDQRGEGR